MSRDTHVTYSQLKRRGDQLTPLEMRALVVIDRRTLTPDALADYVGVRPAQLRSVLDRLVSVGRVREAHGLVYPAAVFS